MPRNVRGDVESVIDSEPNKSAEPVSPRPGHASTQGSTTRRRRILLAAAAGGTAVTLWRRPVIDAVLLPAHAQTSDGELVGVAPPVTPTVPAAPVCLRDERHVDAVPLQDANWSSSLFVPQYDPDSSRIGAPLKSVTIQWRTDIEGEIGLENVEDPAGDTENTQIGATVSARMTLDGPTGNIGVNEPSASRSAYVPGSDGVIDFAGESGRTFEGVTHTQVTEKTYTDAATLAMFTGTGGVEFQATSVASSSTFGSANTAARIITKSSALVRVTYSCE